jgi:pyruvate,orthophosphate dikinase
MMKNEKISEDMLVSDFSSLENLENEMGKKLGDNQDPLLVSVRSGAVISMPGMMDTILNLGLNDESVKGLAAKTE